jgi:hypothetical protein
MLKASVPLGITLSLQVPAPILKDDLVSVKTSS